MMILLLGRDDDQLGHWMAGLGEYGSSVEGIDSLDQLGRKFNSATPDLVLIDIHAKGCDQAAVCDFISDRPGVKFFIFSALHQPQEGVVYISAGARGYGNRLMHPDVLSQSVKVVLSGEIWLGVDLILHLIQANAGAEKQAESLKADKNEKLTDLTSREREIALLVAEGKSNKYIAYELEVTERTVKAHMSSIFKKTQTKDRLQLALLLNG